MILIANIVFLILLEFAFCRQLENRIINGVDANIKDFPFVSSIKIKLCECGEFKHSCMASIASSKVAITAAHCIAGYERAHIKTRNVVVYVGSADLNKGGKHVNVLKWHKHPKYNTNGRIDFDVAVIILKDHLTFSLEIQPIAFENSIKDIAVGTLGTIIGWGSTRNGSSTPSERLQTAQVPYVSSDTCYKEFYEPLGYWEMKDEQMCFGYGKNTTGQKDTCLGDSGGPVVINGTLVGITSYGAHCGEVPGVYTKFSAKEVIGFVKPYVNFYKQSTCRS